MFGLRQALRSGQGLAGATTIQAQCAININVVRATTTFPSIATTSIATTRVLGTTAAGGKACGSGSTTSLLSAALRPAFSSSPSPAWPCKSAAAVEPLPPTTAATTPLAVAQLASSILARRMATVAQREQELLRVLGGAPAARSRLGPRANTFAGALVGGFSARSSGIEWLRAAGTVQRMFSTSAKPTGSTGPTAAAGSAAGVAAAATPGAAGVTSIRIPRILQEMGLAVQVVQVTKPQKDVALWLFFIVGTNASSGNYFV